MQSQGRGYPDHQYGCLWVAKAEGTMFPHPRVHAKSTLHLGAVVHALVRIVPEQLKEG